MSINPVELPVGELFVIPGARFTSIKTFRPSSGISCTVFCVIFRLTEDVETSSNGDSPVTCTDSVTCPSCSVKSAVARMPVRTVNSCKAFLKPAFSTEASYRPGFTNGKK